LSEVSINCSSEEHKFYLLRELPHKYLGHIFLLGFGVILKLRPVAIPRHTAHSGAPLPICTTLQAATTPWDLQPRCPIIPHPDHFPACEWTQGAAMSQEILQQPDLHIVTPG